MSTPKYAVGSLMIFAPQEPVPPDMQRHIGHAVRVESASSAGLSAEYGFRCANHPANSRWYCYEHHLAEPTPARSCTSTSGDQPDADS